MIQYLKKLIYLKKIPLLCIIRIIKKKVGINMFLEISLEVTLILCSIAVFVLALLTVGIIKFVQVCIKQSKRNKRSKANSKRSEFSETAIDIFGGLDNIIETSRQLNRILVKVVNKTIVKFDVLKSMNIGTQITGNIIKCSSEQLADALEDVKKISE